MQDILADQTDLADTPLTRLPGAPDVVTAGRLQAGERLVATARLLGARIRTRELNDDVDFRRVAARAELTFVFRYGVVVSFGAPGASVMDLDAVLAPHLDEPEGTREIETVDIVIRPGGEDRITAEGEINLADASRDRLLLVATVLSRSVVLARDETLVSSVFERSAPVVANLRENGQVRLSIRRVMRFVGNNLTARHRVMGMVQVSERPDLLWDHPELDRLYTRLEADYELEDRAEALERKYGALGDFTDVLLNVVQDKRAYRVEVAIIALIAFEIVVMLIEMAMH